MDPENLAPTEVWTQDRPGSGQLLSPAASPPLADLNENAEGKVMNVKVTYVMLLTKDHTTRIQQTKQAATSGPMAV
jgi:hypothetical protein